MAIQKYILPLFISSTVVGQTSDGLYQKMSFGLTHSTYTNVSFNSVSINQKFNHDKQLAKHQTKIIETQYGFGIGLFMWMPLNEAIVFKPKIEGGFSNACNKQSTSVFATSFDLSFSHGFIIALKKPDENGIIYMARNMTCYLTSKQPYLLIGPKINLKKYDKGYLHKGFENELTFGFLLGYGINYIFQGKNFAPEIYYQISTTAQNKIHDSKKVMHTVAVAINFF